MNTNFNFVVNEDDLLKALESGATMDQIKNIFNSAINKAADKQLQKQKEKEEARIAEERDESLREALDYLLDWYDTYYGEFDYTAPHAIITPQVRERALNFARYIINEYKREAMSNVEVKPCDCASANPEVEKKEEPGAAKPEVKIYTHKIRDPKEIDRILEDFFNQYRL